MRDVWNRIEAALRAAAPEQHAKLPAGASAEAVAATEAELGFALPREVRELYAIHNGSNRVCFLPQDDYGINAVYLLPLDDVVYERNQWVELLDGGDFTGNKARPKGPIKAEWWNRLWVPLTSNGGGDHLCIDLDPAPGGAVGQMIDFSHESGPKAVVGASLLAFLEKFATDLESGRLRYDEQGELSVAEGE